MLRYLLLSGLCFVLFSWAYIPVVNAQNMENNYAPGIGLLFANTHFDLPFYYKAEDTQAAGILTFKQMKNGPVIFQSSLALEPYYMFEGEDDIEAEELLNAGLVTIGPGVKFIVTETTDTDFTVIVNSKTSQEYIIKKDPSKFYFNSEKAFFDSSKGENFNGDWYIFETWETYLQRVEFIELHTLQIFDHPNGNVLFSSDAKDFMPFSVERADGDWVKLKKVALPAADFKEGTDYEGWYRWRDKNKALRIYITEFTVE